MLIMPAALPIVYQSKRVQWGYRSGPELELDGREIDEKSGQVMGGTSTINAIIVNRGNPLDYDGWAVDGLMEWDYAHCLPYFKRMETFADGPDEWRGGSGPMQVSRSEAKHRLYDALLDSGDQSGWGVTSDHNGYRQDGMHIAQASIHRGLRWSTSRAYVRPAVRRSNLHVLSKTHATRIVIDHGTAVAIEVADGPGVTRISAQREVVPYAGAFGSPKLLMLSGTGRRRATPARDPRRRRRGPGRAEPAEPPGRRRAVGHRRLRLADRGDWGQRTARLTAEWGLEDPEVASGPRLIAVGGRSVRTRDEAGPAPALGGVPTRLQHQKQEEDQGYSDENYHGSNLVII